MNRNCTLPHIPTDTRLSAGASFVADESGAMTVDWTVLSASAVAMAIAVTALLTDTVQVLSGRMDGELRSRQLSDSFIEFYASHFGPILETGFISQAQAEDVYNIANGLMNHTIIAELTAGITALEEGTITPEHLVQLVAVASVAFQRNIADDAMLDYYFGFQGSEPYYLVVAGATQSTAG